MPLQDELCFVQFIHPGKEHRPDGNGFMDWNRGPHRRKFLEIGGRCRRNGKEVKGPLRFWGEWEPQSEVIAQIDEPVSDGPRFVQRPYFVVPSKYGQRQNTDPFVFERFFYALCQQNTVKGPTQLRYLSKGSVVLFGSCVSGQFSRSTRFSWSTNGQEFELKGAVNKLQRAVPQSYIEANVRTWNRRTDREAGGGSFCAPTPQQSFRLYSGATIDKRFEGMFSYFPCRPADECEGGFARPVIRLPGWITQSLKQGKRLNHGVTKPQTLDLWQKVKTQVEKADLWLGVNADMPKRRDK